MTETRADGLDLDIIRAKMLIGGSRAWTETTIDALLAECLRLKGELANAEAWLSVGREELSAKLQDLAESRREGEQALRDARALMRRVTELEARVTEDEEAMLLHAVDAIPLTAARQPQAPADGGLLAAAREMREMIGNTDYYSGGPNNDDLSRWDKVLRAANRAPLAPHEGKEKPT